MIRPATVLLVAATRHRAKLRHRRAHPQLAVAAILPALVGVLFVVGRLPLPYAGAIVPEPGAYHYGTVVADRPALVRSLTRQAAAVIGVAATALSAMNAVVDDAWGDQPVELPAGVPLSTAALGVLADQVLESGWFFAPLVAAGGVAFAVGAGSAPALVGALVGGAALLSTALLAGHAAGLAGRRAVRRVPAVYGQRHLVGLAGLAGVFALLAFSRSAGPILAATPVGWYGDLLLSTTPGAGAAIGRGGAVLALSAGLSVGAVAASLPLVRSLWYATTVSTDSPHEGAGSTGRRRLRVVDRLLDRPVSRPTAAVARTVWRRAFRSPQGLFYVVLPLTLAVPATVAAARRLPALVPTLVALYCATAVSVGPTLNPIGNERATLPAVLTAPGGRGALLRGYALAVLLPGAPIAVCATVVVAAASGAALPAIITAGVVAAILAVVGVFVSLGIGAFLPNVSRLNSATLTAPTVHGMLALLLAVGVLATPAVASARIDGAARAAAVAVGGTAAVGGLAGAAGYRYAARRLVRGGIDE